MMKKNHRYTHMYVCMYRLEPFGLLKRLVRRWSTTWQCDLWSYLWLMIISSFSFFPTLPINTAKIHHKKGLFNIFLKVSIVFSGFIFFALVLFVYHWITVLKTFWSHSVSWNIHQPKKIKIKGSWFFLSFFLLVFAGSCIYIYIWCSSFVMSSSH